MRHHKLVSISTFLLITLYLTLTQATTFDIQNHCPYTIWAATIPTGGGKKLDPQSSWKLDINPGTSPVNIWARTKCSFDGSGKGVCETGDCAGVLQCKTPGRNPNTVAEFLVNQGKMDYFNLQLVEGFNVPMQINGVSNGCTKGPKCNSNLNMDCPKELKVSGGCKYDVGNPNSSKFFEDKCPEAMTSTSDSSGAYACPAGTNYKVVLCA